MACSDSGSGRILLCLGLFVVVSSLCNCAALSRLKALDKARPGQLEGSGLRNGRLLIGPNSEQDVKRKETRTTKKRLTFDPDYQADMAWAEAGHGEGGEVSVAKRDNSALERLLRLEPKVECTGNSMKLQVHDASSTPGSLLFVDRGSQHSPLPLSKLPPSCGYTITSTRRVFVLVAPYDGCFVSLQEDNYVLPLRWHELPVRMSCPLMRPSSPNPPMVTCHPEGMVVRTEWTLLVDKIKVNLNGNWEPLMDASSKCGFTVVVHPESVVISAYYAPCLKKKNGMYTLELMGDGETKISCPVLFASQPKPTNPEDPEKQIEMPGKGGQHHIPTHTPQPQAVPEVLPFFSYTWPPQPEKVPEQPVQTPVTHPPDTKVENPFNPYLYYFKPPIHFPAQKPEVNPMSPPAIQKPSNYGTPPPQGKYVPNPFKPPFEGPPSNTHVQPPVSEETKGQIYHPFNQLPWPQGSFQTSSLAPKVQEQHGSLLKPGASEPVFPGMSPSKPASESKKPSQPEAPNGWVYQYFYPHLYLPENKPAAKPTTAPKPATAKQPLQPQAPLGQQLFYQYLLYPPPMPENKPAQTPEDKPSYPKSPTMPSAKTPTEKPAPTAQPPHAKPPTGQLYYPNIYPLQPQLPQPATLPPASSTLPPKQITAQPRNDDAISQNPPPGYSYMSPVHCPQVCPSGFYNCCPQIAFHQHVHHYVPARFGSKDAPMVFPLPLFPSLFPSVTHSGTGKFLTTPPPQEPNEATTIPYFTLPHSPPQNKKQPYLSPLDGTHAAPARGVPKEPSNNEPPIYPYFIPNKHHLFVPQNEMLKNPSQIQTDQYNDPKPQPSGSGPVVQYGPYYVQPTKQQIVQQLPVDMNHPSWHDFMSIIAKRQQQHFANDQNKPSIEQTGTGAYGAVDRPLLTYSILQDQAPVNSSQSSERDSKKPSHEKTIQPKPGSQGYILLQRGPPGREPNRWDHDTSLQHHNSNPPLEKLQRPGWLGKMSNPVPVEHMPQPESEYSIDGSHFVPSRSDMSLSAAHLKPEFMKSLKDMWKPITQGSNQRNPFQ